MKTSDNLDRIFKLGFWINIEWNEGISISYNANDVMPASAYFIDIISCRYYRSEETPYTFEDMMEVFCDFFYEWYNKNTDIIKEFDDKYDETSMSKLEESCYRDVTKRVVRELGINDVLGILEKYEN